MLSRPIPGVDEARRPRSVAKARHSTLLLAAALAAAGCGLSDYEKKMQEADARLQRFDEKNKALGDPVTFPSGEAAPPVDVFLRPPKGVAKEPSQQQGDPPFHFPASGGVCSDVYLMFGNPKDDDDPLKKQIQGWLAAEPSWQRRQVESPGRAPLTFDAAEIADPRPPNNAPAAYLAFIHQTPGRAPVAVVFRVPQASRADADKAIQWSLETYAEAGDASKARGDYAQWHSH
jgi:hypothetical protein